MATHRLEAGPDTVHWGYFDAKLKPLITVDPGDEVSSRRCRARPALSARARIPGSTVPDALQAIHAKVQPKLGGPHIMTGPVAVRGAKAGQVLEVRIKAIDLHYDWGYNIIRPLARRAAGRFRANAPHPYSARPRADGRPAAVGT